MIKIFRKIRQNLLKEGKNGEYVKYALGEIVLVVVGILLALQIDGWNEANKERAAEIIYMENIKADLQLNLVSLKEFIEARETTIKSVEILMDYFNQRIPLDENNFNFHILEVMNWYPFVQQSNTYQELLNSGNLSIISNKSIRSGLQDMQSGYNKISFVENEMQQDYEIYLYEPFFLNANLDASLKNYECQLANVNGIPCSSVDKDVIEKLVKNKGFINGFTLASFNSKTLLKEYTDMVDTTNELIVMINNEVNN